MPSSEPVHLTPQKFPSSPGLKVNFYYRPSTVHPLTSMMFRLNDAQQGFRRPTTEVSDQQIAATPVGYDNSLLISDLDPVTTELFETYIKEVKSSS
jgi:hypothetical protein